MLESFPRRAGRAALIMSAVLATAVPAGAQYATGPLRAESPEDALARNVRLVAQNPRDFLALVAAGRAALATGDSQAAVGFFGRAEELSPRAWQPQAGMAAAMVAMGEPQGAFSYFARAQQYGALHLQIAVDRGLAFDLIGDQARAQSDYRAALIGSEADEARRRLALSLAISRDIKGAAATIEPLLVRRDSEAVRANAFILALAGDREGARRTIDTFMPGAGLRFEPFFKSLPSLQPAEKAAAVHLGIFPNAAAQRYSQAVPVPSPPAVVTSSSVAKPQAAQGSRPAQRDAGTPIKIADARREAPVTPKPPTEIVTLGPSRDVSRYAATRVPRTQTSDSTKAEAAKDPEPRPDGGLDDIVKLLSETPADQPVVEPLTQVAEAQVAETAPAADPANVSRPKPKVSRPKVERTKAAEDKKKSAKLLAEKKAKAEADKKERAETVKRGVSGTTWVQLAGGANQDRLGAEYRKLASKAGSLLKSRSGYVTEGKDYFRLLVGPFSSSDEAQEFVRKLDKAGVDSFRWTRNPAQIRIEKLKT
jgi:tetratricopeptide (TPR) repeat protein